jgi:hypothetical protein
LRPFAWLFVLTACLHCSYFLPQADLFSLLIWGP